MSPPEAAPASPPPPAVRAYRAGRHLRAALALLFVSVLLLAGAYPLALVGFGELVNPKGAQGSLTYDPNGTVNNSSLLPPGTSSTFGGVVRLPVPGAGAPGARAAPVETLLYGEPPRADVPRTAAPLPAAGSPVLAVPEPGGTGR